MFEESSTEPMREFSTLAVGQSKLNSSQPPGPQKMVPALRTATRELHRIAERSGIVRELLCGRGDVVDYALLQRNLLPAYRSMEQALQYRQREPLYRTIASPAVFRASAIEADLRAMVGKRWSRQLPVLAVARGYAERIAEVGYAGDVRLLAHTYTRYLGDLNGGQILKTLLKRSLGLPADVLTFHEFPMINDLAEFRLNYLSGLNAAVTDSTTIGIVAEEARRAFQFNIDLSDAVFAQRLQTGIN
ncbi:MAG TPA: biliverdin-producing heme oxygenase [Woeseiaceae bacterium]